MILLHTDPKTAAERLAQRLEVNYGLQLDAARHSALLEDIESFFPAVVVETESADNTATVADAAQPAAKPRKAKERR